MDRTNWIVNDYNENISEKKKACARPKHKHNKTRLSDGSESGYKSYQLGKYVPYAVFKRWPKDIRFAYLKDINDRYTYIGIPDIAEMFGINYKTLWSANSNLGHPIKKKNPGHYNSDHKKELEKFLHDFECTDKTNEEVKLDSVTSDASNSNIDVIPMSISTTFEINMDNVNIDKYLKAIGFNGRIIITVNKKFGGGNNNE